MPAVPVLEAAFSESSEEDAHVTQEPPAASAPVSATSDPGPADAPAMPASEAVGVSLEDVFGQTPGAQEASVEEAVRESTGATREDSEAEVAAAEASTPAPEEDKPVSFPRTGRMERILKDQGLASGTPESVPSAEVARVATTPAAEAKHPQNLRREPRSLFDLFSPEERSELFLEPYRQEEK